MNPFKRAKRAEEFFERQFQANGEDFIYRKHGTGAAYRVTPREREEMIAAFRRGMRWTTFGIIAAISVFAAALSGFDRSESKIAFFAVGVGAFIPLYIAFKRLYAGPEFRLQHRATVAREMSADERKRHVLSQISYWQLAIMPFLGLLILAWIADEIDVTKDWGRTAWLVPACFTILAAVQGWRKFSLSRKG